jgi:hypothetical protein
MLNSLQDWLSKPHVIQLGFSREIVFSFHWSLLIAPVAVLLILFLYLYELQVVRWFKAIPLLLLRLTILFVLLTLVGFEPIFVHTTTEVLPGRVLIVVDRSDSTGVVDKQRPVVEKLRLAKALKLVDDFCPNDQLDGWIQRCGAKGEAPSIGEGSERDEFKKVVERVDALTRAEAARRVLSDDGAGLLRILADKHHVDLMGFGRETWDVPADQVDGLFGIVKPGDEPKIVPVGKNEVLVVEKPLPTPLPPGATQGTDLLLPLTRALERTGPDSAKILGVVVLTDGQHNVGPSPVAKAVELGDKEIPVFPVALGARQAPPDIAVLSVKAPTTVFKDTDAPVDVHFKVSGLAAQDLVVDLHRAGHADPLETRVIHHDGKDGPRSERFQVHFENKDGKETTQTYTVSVKPVAKETEEIRIDNNSRSIKVSVADDKARVLLIDGEARWEYHYLASALIRDRVMDVKSVVFAQPRVGKIAEEELEKIGNPSMKLPSEPDALSGYDCIVLGDVMPDQLTPAERVLLEKYVADRGGTLVLLAGKRAMPLSFLGGQPDKSDDPLIKMLPIEQPRAVQPDPSLGFHVSLTLDGQESAFLQMDPAADKSLARWKELPPHFWGVVGKAKPGATVLGYVDPGFGEDAGKREKENALIVRHSYGFGRVLFVGLDSTWRWRYKVGDTYHHRFWGQVVRWAATDKPLVEGNEWVRFGTREPVYNQGQEVEVVVRLSEDTPKLRPDALAGARLFQVIDGKPKEIALATLTHREAQPRVLEAKVHNLPAGQYAIELAIPDLEGKLQGKPGPDGTAQPLRALFTINPTGNEEMSELASNWPLLEEIAVNSGGEFYTPDQATELAKKLTSRAVTRPEHAENRLWQWWPMLVLLLLLLTLEWVGRKWAGLP